MAKNVLILVYSLSLHEGVGARRWSKYGLELAKLNNNVFIVGAENILNDFIDHENIQYYTFKTSYPRVLDSVPKSIIEKIQYRFALYFQRLKTKGAIFDKAFRDEKEINDLIFKVVNENDISNLIVTGAPFSLFHFAVKLKARIPKVNLISDVRDAWTWGEGYGMSVLTKERKEHEKRQELEMMTKSDFVTVASEDLKLVLQKNYPALGSKVEVLLNGVEFNNNVVKRNEVDNSKIRIVHIGSVNVGTEKYWKPFLSFVKEFENKIQLIFVGGINSLVRSFVSESKMSNVKFINRLPEAELKSYLEKSHFVLMFKKDGFENSFPTKFFDYIKYERLIIAFTKSGIVSEEIIKNDLGVVFETSFDSSELLSFLEENMNGEYITDYNKLKFSIKSLASEITLKLK